MKEEKRFGELESNKTRNVQEVTPFETINMGLTIREIAKTYGKALKAFASGNEMLIAVLMTNDLNKEQMKVLLEISGLSTKGKEQARVNGFLTFDRGEKGDQCFPRKGYEVINKGGTYTVKKA